jgi:hypothetical protein
LLASWPGVWLRGREGGGTRSFEDSSDSSGISGLTSEIFWERTTLALRGDLDDLSEDLAESAMLSRWRTASDHGPVKIFVKVERGASRLARNRNVEEQWESNVNIRLTWAGFGRCERFRGPTKGDRIAALDKIGCQLLPGAESRRRLLVVQHGVLVVRVRSVESSAVHTIMPRFHRSAVRRMNPCRQGNRADAVIYNTPLSPTGGKAVH